jgi:sec-independent protein translocase protein TatA
MKTLLFLGGLGAGEIVAISLVVLLLFGGKKIPELMRGIGKGVKSFKDGVKGIEDDINASLEEDSSATKSKDEK